MENWEVNAFRANPIIGWQHNVYGGGMCTDPDPDQIIGRGDVQIDNGEMFVDITFEEADNNPLAEKIFRKVKKGILNAVSVGFREIGEGRQGDEERGESPDVYYFNGQELLEISVVSIPSNKNALVKSLRSQTASALNYIYKELGGKYKFSDIENMRVRDVMDLIEGKEVRDFEKDLTETPGKVVKVKKVYEVKRITNRPL
jgi:HK97 family phage prohead protease